MIRTYSVVELEEISGVGRRTIGDYVAKGLLSGPSHRGRGAQYPQSDVDALTIIPRLRTLMKNEFSNLRVVTRFLRQLSGYDLHELATKTSDYTFILATRCLRVRLSLTALLPQVPQETINQALNKLTPEQLRAIDTGRQQLGSVIDLAALLNGSQPVLAAPYAPADQISNASWSVGWLEESSYQHPLSETLQPADVGSLSEIVGALEQKIHDNAARPDAAQLKVSTAETLRDIVTRVARLEELLATS